VGFGSLRTRLRGRSPKSSSIPSISLIAFTRERPGGVEKSNVAGPERRS
jgi:hypothetical protein